MARRTSYPHGTFCAVDLLTPDREAAKAFYAALHGWTGEDFDEMGYTGLKLGDAVVAGAITISDEMARDGAVPAWSTYVKVDDADALAARVGELGGTVVAGPTEIPGVGRAVVFTDPQGGFLQAWEPGGFEGVDVVNEVGAWVWNDLQTNDPEGAAPFYAELFGWEVSLVEASHDTYWSVSSGGRGIGGIMRSDTPHPFWTVYFGVESIEAAQERVASAGGTTILEPIAVPAGRFTLVQDPQGAVLGLIEGKFDD